MPEQGAAGMEGMLGMGTMPGSEEMSMSGMGSGMGPAGLGAMQINRSQSSGLGTIEALPGCLVITQCQRVHRGVADLLAQLKAQAAEAESRAENPAQAAIRRALDAPTSVEYAGVPLEKVIGEFANRFGINFVAQRVLAYVTVIVFNRRVRVGTGAGHTASAGSTAGCGNRRPGVSAP